MDFLKESLVSAEEQVRALQNDIAEVTGLRAKVEALESQLLSTEIDKESIVRDMTLHGEEVSLTFLNLNSRRVRCLDLGESAHFQLLDKLC